MIKIFYCVHSIVFLFIGLSMGKCNISFSLYIKINMPELLKLHYVSEVSEFLNCFVSLLMFNIAIKYFRLYNLLFYYEI